MSLDKKKHLTMAEYMKVFSNRFELTHRAIAIAREQILAGKKDLDVTQLLENLLVKEQESSKKEQESSKEV